MSTNIREARIAFGFKKQSTISTASISADLWQMNKMNSQLADVQFGTEINNDIGVGTDFVTEVFKTGKSMSIAMEKPATSQFAAWAFGFGLGKTTKTGTGPWVYTSTPTVGSVDGIGLPAFTCIEALRAGTGGELFNRAMIGNVVNDFKFTVEKGPTRSASRLSVNCVGTGNTIDTNVIAFPASTTVEHRMPSASAAVTINGVNYITGGWLESLELTYNNNIRTDDMYFPGSGVQNGFAIGGRMEFGDRRTCGLTFTARGAPTSPEITTLRNLTEGTAVITLTGDLISGGDFHTTTITLHRNVFSALSFADANGIVTVNVTCQPMWHSTNGLITTATKTNIDAITT